MAGEVPDDAVSADTRGIVDPAAMMRLVDFDRLPPGPVLDGLVEWFWTVAWDLPPEMVHDQQVLNHPAGNISVGTIDDAGVTLDPPEGRVYGVLNSVSNRHLAGRGWTVAARTTVGGLGVFLGGSAKAAADRQLTFGEALPGLEDKALVADIGGLERNHERVERLRAALESLVASRPPAMIDEARSVAEVAALAERDRTICRVEQLASAAGVSVRSLQRLFDTHVGASPSFVIRRWRIIEAAEAAKSAVAASVAAQGRAIAAEAWPGWSAVAADLGYADQAHLARDFRRYLGVPPSAYVTRNLERPA